MGSLEMLRKRIEGDPRALRLLDNAMMGAERGAALTQRLLAFARRQELRPEAINVGRLVSGMQDLLSRSLGPEVRVAQEIDHSLPAIRIDADRRRRDHFRHRSTRAERRARGRRPFARGLCAP